MPCNVSTIDSGQKKGGSDRRREELEEGRHEGGGCDIGQEVPPLGQCEDGEGVVGWKGGGDIAAQSLASHGSAVTLENDLVCEVL